IRRLDGLAEACIEVLKRQEGVTDVRVNRTCASIVINYDRTPENFLPALEAGLGLLTPQMIIAIAAAQQKSEGRPATAEGELAEEGRAVAVGTLERMALPTLTLGLGLIGGPVGAALAVPLITYNALPTLKRAYDVIRHEQRLNVDFLDGLAITI